MMHPRSSEIANSILFGWYIPMWFLMGCIPSAFLELNEQTTAPVQDEDHIRSLIEANRQQWQDYINHPFPCQMACGTAPLNGFRHYMIQDATYLEFYARVRMQSIANSKSKAAFGDLEHSRRKESDGFEYAKYTRNVCETCLGIPKDVVENEPMSQQLRNSIALYERVARDGDWLDMHIVLLPCIMGYYTIASRLLADPETIRNTVFHSLWIQENASGGTFKRYKKFIADYINELPESEKRWEYWIELFGKACQTERAFFDLAYEDVKYDVVSDGLYKIRSFGKGGHYLAPSERGNVVALQDELEENWTWELTNAKDGYLIRNVSSGALLGVSVTKEFPPYHEVNNEGEGYTSWSLVPTPGEQSFQFLVSSKSQFTLDVDVRENGSTVFVANSYAGSSQLWILEPVV